MTKYVGYDLSETSYADASSVTDDTIMEQVETAYDDASNVIQTTTRQRFHNATGTGALSYPGGSQPVARVTYVAMYPDAIGRTQAVADYGTNGDASFTRSVDDPARADTVLVNSTLFNSRGEAYQSIDPAGWSASSHSTTRAARSSSSLTRSEVPAAVDQLVLLIVVNRPAGLRRQEQHDPMDLHGRQPDRHGHGRQLGDRQPGHHLQLWHHARRLRHCPQRPRRFGRLPRTASEAVKYLYNRQSQVKQFTDIANRNLSR